MKNKGIFLAANLLFFSIGIVIGVYLIPQKENNKEIKTQSILPILQNENKWLGSTFDEIIAYSNIAKVDKESELSILINNTQKAINSLNTLLKNPSQLAKLNKNTLEDILPSIVDNTTLSNIQFNENIADNEVLVNLYKHILLSRFLYEYRKSSLMYEWAKCVVVPITDTLKIGDVYDATIYFTIKGLTTDQIIEMDNGVLLKDGHYQEVAKQKGVNKRTGIYRCFNGWEIKHWPIKFEFYVK